MKATERTFQQIIVSPDRYVIPVFQRHYSWTKENWKKLWDDLMDISQEGRSHFLGSIVCISDEHMPGVPPSYQVIDGQQRLMTLAILLCAMRHAAKKEEWHKLAAEIEENFLIHKFEKNSERYRIYPRMRDRQIYTTLVDNSDLEIGTFSNSESLLNKAYVYFRKQLHNDSSHDISCLDNENQLQRIFEAIKTQLDFVIIILGPEDPYKIFKSLNSTGLDLNQGDLIRNHVFMAIAEKEQDAFDDNHWVQLEKYFEEKGKLDGKLFASFFRDVLMSSGEYVQENEVFKKFENRYPRKDIEPFSLANTLNNQAMQYNIIRGMDVHPLIHVEKALKDIRDLKITASYPLILALFRKYQEKKLTDEELTQALQAIASFVIRRHVCRESTRTHGPWFCSACKELADRPLVNLIKYLQSKYWPSDDKFISALQTMNLYSSNHKQVILRGLEQHLQAKSEPVGLNNCHIEHVMPQTIGSSDYGKMWQADLGPEWQHIHDRYVDTLGNLTLVGADYNKSMQNQPFHMKKGTLSTSKVYLNGYFAHSSLIEWNEKEIVERAEILSQYATKIWVRPPDEADSLSYL